MAWLPPVQIATPVLGRISQRETPDTVASSPCWGRSPRCSLRRTCPSGRREEGELAGRKSRDPELSCSSVASDLLLLQAASPDRLEAGQPGEDEAARPADILIADLAGEARHLKTRKKRCLLPGEDRAGRGQGLGSWALPGPPGHPGSETVPDVRRFFTINCRNVCRVTCTLPPSIRQGRIKGRSQPSALVCHLAAKRGQEVGRKPAAAGPGGERGGVPEKKQKDLPTGAPAVPRGAAFTMLPPGASPLEDGDGQVGPSSWYRFGLPRLLPPTAAGED